MFNIIKRIFTAIIARDVDNVDVERLFEAAQAAEDEAALTAPVIEVRRHRGLAKLTMVPVRPRRGVIAWRAVINHGPMEEARVFIEHERAHLDTGMPMRARPRDLSLVPRGDMGWYGILPGATARIEEATNRLAIARLSEAGATAEERAMLIAAQETYWVAEEAAKCVTEQPRELLGNLVARGGRAALVSLMESARKRSRKRGAALAEELGISKAALKAGRKRMRSALRSSQEGT